MIRSLALLPLFLLLAGCFSQAPAPTSDRAPSAQSRAVATTVAVPPVPSGPGFYTVKKGDTLYRIALEHGQDYRDLAQWNNLTNPGNIKEGQVLRVAPPAGGDGGGEAVVAKPVVTAPAVESRSLDKPPGTGDGVKREPRGNKEPYSDEAYARLGKVGEAPVRSADAKGEAKPEARVEPRPEAPPVVPPAGTATPAAASGPDDVNWGWPAPGKVLAPYSDGGNKGLDIGGKAGDAVVAAGDGKVVYAGTGLRGYGQLVIVKHNNTFLSAYAHNQKILVKEGQIVTRGQKIAEMGSTDSDTVKLHFEIRRQGKPIDPQAYLPKK